MKFLKLSLSYGLPFGLAMGVFFGLQHGLWFGVFGGIAAGVLFGICMSIPLSIRRGVIDELKNSVRDTVAEHEIILESHVNLAGGLSKDGWLYLTKDKLVFIRKATKKSSLYKKEILLDTIEDVKVCALRLNKNAFSITHNGQEHKFFMYDQGISTIVNNNVWVETIKTTIKNLSSQTYPTPTNTI